MKKKSSYFIILLLVLSLPFYFLWKQQQKQKKIHLNPVSYEVLPGWGQKNLRPSFVAFQASCKVFLKISPDKKVGSNIIPLKAQDWQPICQAALSPHAPQTSKQIQKFIETWLAPVEFYQDKKVQGLFTGYYMSELKGSLTKTEQFNVPIYGYPQDLISVQLNLFSPDFQRRKIVGRVTPTHQLVPYYTRAEIDRGAIAEKAPIIAWVDSKVDRLFLEIQGSGVIKLPEGRSLYVTYAAENGAPYTAIAGVLIKKGLMTKDNASMQHIRSYLEAHPNEIQSILNHNKSFVFFETTKRAAAFGSQGTTLTPGYSLAVDLSWVPIGAPIWLNTNRPDENVIDKHYPFQRLMIAQDTGGAIRGPVRGDVYWGEGEKATAVAGRMKHPGHYWLLLPKSFVKTLSS